MTAVTKLKTADVTCPKCRGKTTAKQLDRYNGSCKACFTPAYDRKKAQRTIGRLRGRQGWVWDSVVAEMKRLMHPPPGGQWNVPTVIEHDSERLNW